MNYTGDVRRTENNLRAKFPSLETTIYDVGNGHFVIHCNNLPIEFALIERQFNDEIRKIGSRISLANEPPEKFISIVPKISDDNISSGFEGIFLSNFDLINLLTAKFPTSYVCKVELMPGGRLAIHTASFKESDPSGVYHRFASNDTKRKMLEFLQQLNIAEFVIIEDELDSFPEITGPPASIESPVFRLDAANLNRRERLEFCERDEALWFDNIDAVFNCSFKKEQLFFFNNKDYACYFDASLPNINLRNHILLFQTVYLTPPFEKNLTGWLQENKIEKFEFLELVQRERIKLILTQPESRYDIKFLKEVYEVDKKSIISRRALALLQQLDVVELSQNYLFNDPALLSELPQLAQDLTRKGEDPNIALNMLLWPISARRTSFELLNRSGLISVASFGVNSAIEKIISKAAKKDLSFEFTTLSPQIHLANALNATYFPFRTKDGFTDIGYATIMGEYLNMYRNLTLDNLNPYLEQRKRKENGVLPIQPIDVIEVNEYMSILEFEAFASKSGIFPGSKRLMETLSSLTVDERKKKIRYYNEEVVKRIHEKRRLNAVIDLGRDLLLDYIGAGVPLAILETIFSGSSSAAKTGAKYNNLRNKIEEAFMVDKDNLNIHYLRKINPIAKLKNYHSS